MKSLLMNQGIPQKTRGGVYESCIRSVLLYGSETWALTERMKGVLRACDWRMLRYIAGMRWQDGLSSEQVARCGFRSWR